MRKHELKGKSKQRDLRGKNELVFVLVLRAKALIQILSDRKSCLIYNDLESLILAQDERWRRA